MLLLDTESFETPPHRRTRVHTHTKQGGGRGGDQSEILVSVRIPLIKTINPWQGFMFSPLLLIKGDTSYRLGQWREDSSFNDLSHIFDDSEKCLTSDKHHVSKKAPIQNTEGSGGLLHPGDKMARVGDLTYLPTHLPTHPPRNENTQDL